MAEKRKRNQNFTLEEKHKLIRLLGPRKEIILNKKTDNATNEAKNRAWTDLTNDFNATTSVHRSKESLIKVWEKMKTDSKLYYQTIKQSSMENKMPPAENSINPVLEQICSLLEQEQRGVIDVPNCDANKMLEVVLDVQENPVEFSEEQSANGFKYQQECETSSDEEEYLKIATRKRVPNFSCEEKALLTRLIKNNPVIVSKLTDGKTVKKKKATWILITDQFNSNAHVHKRDTVTLKRAWDNLKAAARKSKITPQKTPVIIPRHLQQDSLVKMVQEAAPAKVNRETKREYGHEHVILSIKQENEDVYGQEDKSEASFNQDMLSIEDLDDSRTSSPCMALTEDFEELADSNSHQNTQTSNDLSYKHNNVYQDNADMTGTSRKVGNKTDYGRLEAALRIKHFQAKAKLEFQVLKAKLQNEAIKKHAAELEERTNRTLLEKANLELLELKRRMGID